MPNRWPRRFASRWARQKARKSAAKGAAIGVAAVKETVKVDADRLDRLLDTIGELVIAESMIQGSPELKGRVSPKLVQQMGQLDKITRELQEMGTSLRMVPVRPTFQKMARLVRDLSKNSGKAVNFLTVGEETELDKTVVEKIGDPLVHMLRNSLDHGIESDPGDRIKAGKPATATVRLSAFQKGGNVCIEISDDGKGLNRDAILNKARERGLIKDDANPPDKEVWGYIFEAGFSTAKQVTELSGRGVGMDVVKRNIEILRGRIDIHSVPGQGTTFSIWLPLTLAIIDGMVVRIADERYVFPTLSIVRIVSYQEKDRLTVKGKGEMLTVEGELVPFFPLKDYFRPDGERPAQAARLIVIAESEGRRSAFPVDELAGTTANRDQEAGDGVPEPARIVRRRHPFGRLRRPDPGHGRPDETRILTMRYGMAEKAGKGQMNTHFRHYSAICRNVMLRRNNRRRIGRFPEVLPGLDPGHAEEHNGNQSEDGFHAVSGEPCGVAVPPLSDQDLRNFRFLPGYRTWITKEENMSAGKYLTFKLGPEDFGIGILKVQEIIGMMAVTRMPRTPAYVRGVVNLRGKVIPVLDLRLKFGMETREDTERTCIIVVQLQSSGSEITMGIIVDEVSEVLDVAATQIEPAPSFGSAVDVSFIMGMGKVGQKVVQLLDADRILMRQELEAIGNGAASEPVGEHT